MSNFGKTIVLVLLVLVIGGGYAMYRSQEGDTDAGTPVETEISTYSGAGYSVDYPNYMNVVDNAAPTSGTLFMEKAESDLFRQGTDAKLKMVRLSVESGPHAFDPESLGTSTGNIKAGDLAFGGYVNDEPEMEMGVEDGGVIGYIPTLYYYANTPEKSILFTYSNYKLNNSEHSENERIEDFKKMVASFKFTN